MTSEHPNGKSKLLQRMVAIRDSKLPANEKLMLYILLGYLGFNVECWPTQPTLAKLMCVEVRQVRRILQSLEASKIVGKRHAGRRNYYSIDWPELRSSITGDKETPVTHDRSMRSPMTGQCGHQ